LRILIFNEFTSTFGGTDSVVNTEINGLRKAGHTVRLFSYNNKEFLGLKLSQKYFIAIKSCFKTFYLKEFQSIIDEFNPDIIHFHNMYQLFRTPIWNWINPQSAKTILHLHNYYPLCLNSFFFTESICTRCFDENSWSPGIKLKCYNSSLLQTTFIKISRPLPKEWIKLSRKIDRFITVSNFISIVYCNSGIDSQKITFLPNSVEMDNVETTSFNGEYILYLGAITKLKGVEWVCKIAEKLKEIPFVIAGEGKDYLYLKEKYKTLHNLEFAGYVKDEKKNNLLQHCRFIIFPTMGWESFGLSILEGYSYGKPVLTTGLGGISEIVKHGLTGIIVEELTLASFSKQTKRLWDETYESDFYSTNCREFVKNYSIDNHIKQLTKIYEETLS